MYLTKALMCVMLAVTPITVAAQTPPPKDNIVDLVSDIIPLCQQDLIAYGKGEKDWLMKQVQVSEMNPATKMFIYGVCIAYIRGLIEGRAAKPAKVHQL